MPKPLLAYPQPNDNRRQPGAKPCHVQPGRLPPSRSPEAHRVPGSSETVVRLSLSPARGVLLLRPHIVLDLDPELGDYLASELARSWPRARVSRQPCVRPLDADLLVVDCEPRLPPCCPTLWLAEIDGTSALREVAPGFWRTAMPTTAARLRQTLETCLQRICEHASSPR